MKYTFKDIENQEMYESTMVIVVAGQYNIFNNIVADELKDRCRSRDSFEVDDDLLGEFSIDSKETSNISVSNVVDFKTFMDVINIPNINGKWFCSVQLELLSKKQIETMDKYLKNPSNNGILVIISHEFKDFKKYLRNKALLLGKNSHIIQLGFPNKNVLTQIVKKLFKNRNVEIDTRSSQLFVMRMSNAYDDYEKIIDKICLDRNGSKLAYEDLQLELKGIDNYILDDFIEGLLRPVKSDKISTKRLIYRMLGSLINEMGAVKLVSKVKYKVDDYIAFRIAINSGIIPVKVKFSVPEAKSKLGEGHKLYKIPDFRFRKMATIASLTSLKDWVYMKMILNSVKRSYDTAENERALYVLIHRAVLSQSRLNNNLGIENVLNNDIKKLDNVGYISEELIFSR